MIDVIEWLQPKEYTINVEGTGEISTHRHDLPSQNTHMTSLQMKNTRPLFIGNALSGEPIYPTGAFRVSSWHGSDLSSTMLSRQTILPECPPVESFPDSTGLLSCSHFTTVTPVVYNPHDRVRVLCLLHLNSINMYSNSHIHKTMH